MNNQRPPLIAGLILLLALAVAALGWGLVRKPQLDSSSNELAVTLTTAILHSGSTDQLLAIAHPTLIQNNPIETIQAQLTMVSFRLGSWNSVDTISGAASLPLLPFLGGATTASYEIGLSYAVAPAKAVIEMIFEQGNWYVTSFNITSERLLP